MTPLPILRGEGVTLRPLVIGDAEALFRVHGDEAVHHFWSGPAHPNVERTREGIALGLANPTTRLWAIVDPSDELVGRIATFDVRDGVEEVGIILRSDVAGKGYASRALALVIEHAFANGTHRIVADIDPENTASLSLFERAGFEREGHLRQNWITHLGVRDSVIMARLKSPD